jgi:hypothetical protein
VMITGVSEIRRQFQEINDFLGSKKPMEGLVEDAKAVILEKTAAGRDYEHHAFTPYSEKYAKRKVSSRVNLKKSGTMLGAIKTAVPEARHGQIYVAAEPEPGGKINADLLANIHTTGTGKQPRREFMNLSKTQKALLKKKHYDDPILEIVRKYR